MLRSLMGAGALCAVMAAPAAADLRFSIGVPENFTIVKAMKYFADTIPGRTNNAVTVRLFTGSSLLNFPETFTGIRDGVADMGYVVGSYHRAELKETNLIGDLGMLGSNLVAMAGAASEYCYTDPECVAEYVRMGQIFLGFTSTPPYVLISKTPLESQDDLRGKRIRSFSAYGRWAEAMGGAQVNLPAGDIYQAFSQGAIDVNMHPFEALVTLSLSDVAKHVTDLQLGTFYINAIFNTNLDRWRSWPADVRVAVMQTAAEGMGHAAAATFAEDAAFREGGVDRLGVTVHQPNEALLAATAAFIEQDLLGIADLNERQFGVSNAAEKIARFRALIEKWEGLVAGIDPTDPEQVAALYRDNIFGDIDLSSYGM